MKLIPYSRQCIDESDIRQVVKTLRSDWITQGPRINEFECALSKYTGAKYAVAVANGTAGLHLACLAAGIKKGDEVITSPMTFVASANCILYCGGKPVFTDIQEDTQNIDPEEIIDKITKNSKAIIPVHFAGHPCDLKRIQSIAKKHNLIVIEDAAHALGAEYRDSKIGSCKYSDMAVFSFHPVKSITTGEGGAVLTNRKDLYKRLLLLRNHGIAKDRKKIKKTGSWYYEMQHLGFNYRITDFQCALGISQLGKIDKFIDKKRKIVKLYDRNLSQISTIILPKERNYVKSSWHIYCIRLKNASVRRFVFDKLKKYHIGIQVHYIPVHLQPYYRKNLGYKKGDYPKAERYYSKAITIPLFPGLTNREVEYICSNIKRILCQ
ncbi:MAG: UDP-4-amino-4,6-dideoxy-N-acetyl-beta-L-altrosamine transaminase [Candidatus Omnitrophica bacterium]|nr:UDP-4-amino-4,6-dideoxy-N-acetyl-beta-L-altrosamine transaminase [Candidatus Omnitrophota bacterium]MDD5352402.1 UDP-4-amino-4,6-dideoxy-N-acetyl-beta-L-altrosamine transaminase [Candidatus Omnitrophota bacterium]MDD5550000.1 UDP-4-amino-4,6-dideoxy-N-acetyl-beta-L-altrosamine transaminase [Candidatus Omnitrophota bacterium]